MDCHTPISGFFIRKIQEKSKNYNFLKKNPKNFRYPSPYQLSFLMPFSQRKHFRSHIDNEKEGNTSFRTYAIKKKQNWWRIQKFEGAQGDTKLFERNGFASDTYYHNLVMGIPPTLVSLAPPALSRRGPTSYFMFRFIWSCPLSKNSTIKKYFFVPVSF